MGCYREQEMWRWLEEHQEDASRRYVAEVRSIVMSPDFGPHEVIDDFFTWCMENFDNKRTMISDQEIRNALKPYMGIYCEWIIRFRTTLDHDDPLVKEIFRCYEEYREERGNLMALFVAIDNYCVERQVTSPSQYSIGECRWKDGDTNGNNSTTDT